MIRDFHEQTVYAIADELMSFLQKEEIPDELRAAPDIGVVWSGQFTDDDLIVVARNVLQRLETVALVGSLNKYAR